MRAASGMWPVSGCHGQGLRARGAGGVGDGLEAIG